MQSAESFVIPRTVRQPEPLRIVRSITVIDIPSTQDFKTYFLADEPEVKAATVVGIFLETAPWVRKPLDSGVPESQLQIVSSTTMRVAWFNFVDVNGAQVLSNFPAMFLVSPGVARFPMKNFNCKIDPAQSQFIVYGRPFVGLGAIVLNYLIV